MPSRGRETFLAGLVIVGFLVLLYGGIWFFTPAPHRETIMLPYAKHAVLEVSGRFAKSDVILVAGGCGVGFHRGPYGYCVSKWACSRASCSGCSARMLRPATILVHMAVGVGQWG